MDEQHVQRTAEVDLDTAGTLRALTDPEVLAAWLGRWERSPADGTAGGTATDRPAGDTTAVVTTDDGVRRTVRDLEIRPDGVRWSWTPIDRPDATSHVTIEIEPVTSDRTRLTVHEVSALASRSVRAAGRCDAPTVALDGIKWSVCLLVLEIAAASSMQPATAV